jgi:hypothetical protein
MASVHPLLQGILFAGVNTALLLHATDALGEPLRLQADLYPRVLAFHALACLVLGSVMFESFAAHVDAAGRPVVGPVGTFLATWAGLYALALAALLSGERALLVPGCFAVAYAAGLARAANHLPAPVGAAAAAVALAVGLVLLLVDEPRIQEAAGAFGEALGLEDAKEARPRRGYLLRDGGALESPWFSVGFTTLGSYALLWALASTPTATFGGPAPSPLQQATLGLSAAHAHGRLGRSTPGP